MPKFFAVGSDYFATVGTTIQEGRAFDPRKALGSDRVVVLSRTLAKRLWRTKSALGQCVFVGDSSSFCARVAGIAGDITDLHGVPRPVFYLPIDQTPVFDNVSIVARFIGSVGQARQAIRSSLLALDPGVEYIDVRRLSDYIEPQVRPWRLASIMLSLMALLALTIAGIGIFGSTAYIVMNRAREIAVRQAVGATPVRVLLFLVRRSAGPSWAGILLGTAASIPIFYYVRGLLFEPSEKPVAVFITAASILILVAVGAAMVFGIRASRRTIASALRSD